MTNYIARRPNQISTFRVQGERVVYFASELARYRAVRLDAFLQNLFNAGFIVRVVVK